MKRFTSLAAGAVITAGFAFVGLGCEGDGQEGDSASTMPADMGDQGEHPEHPSGDHPEHPSGDHPEHPSGDHPDHPKG